MQPVPCAGCQALQRRLHDLQAENERLRRQLEATLRAGKRQAAPFAKGQPTASPKKYPDELLDAYILVEDADALYSEYAARGVEFTRGIANMPWHSREFVVKDCDGRLLAFGANV